MLRASSYNIYVELPDTSEEMLLIHGYTGAYDKVSRRVGRYVRAMGGRQKTQPPPEPRSETLAVLRRRGYLTEKTHEEEERIFSQLAELLHQRAKARQPGYVFMPTYSCNLRCPYCFQDHMRTDPKLGHLLRTMQPAMVDRIFATLPQLEEMHGLEPDPKRSRTYLFFGGEPLLARSRPVVEKIMEAATRYGEAHFSAISNATDLDSYEDLLGPDKIKTIQVTLDGPPAEHDQRRVYADGSGSFERIADNISMALEKGTRINVRMNVDAKNLERLPRLADEIVARGWPSCKHFSAYVAAIHSGSERADSEAIMDTWRLGKGLQGLQDKYPMMQIIGTTDGGLVPRLQRIFEEQQDPTPGFRATFCGAQTTMYVFDAFGDIYSCWEHTGDPEIRVGHIAADGELELSEGYLDLWQSRNVSTNPVCRRCRYAFYCGGGCASMAYQQTGELHRNFCDGFSHRFRSAAARAYLAFASGAPAEAVDEAACDR